MPVPQPVVPRLTALQYDGTNSADVLDFIQTGMPGGWGTTWAIHSETGGVLTVRSGNPDVWSDIAVPAGYILVMPTGDLLPQAIYEARFRPIQA